MIRETHDMDTVNSILQHPDIWADIAPRGTLPFDIGFVPGVMHHLVGDGDGVISYHLFRDGVKIHPNILPSKRGKQAYDAVEESIQMVFADAAQIIYCEIDPRLRHVIMFARALGFKWIEGGVREIYVRYKLDS